MKVSMNYGILEREAFSEKKKEIKLNTNKNWLNLNTTNYSQLVE